VKSIAWLLLFSAFFVLGFTPLKESDTFMYLALAREFFRNGHFPVQDPFILPAPGSEWRVVYEWGGFVYYYLAYLAAGYTGVILAKIGLASIAWWPSVAKVWREFRSSAVHFALFFLGLIAFTLRYSERTSLVADVLMMMTLAVIVSDWQGSLRARWWLPVIAVVWINCHGSFPLVWLLAMMWIGGRAVAGDFQGAVQRLPVLGFSLLTPIFNPEGWAGITYPFQFISFKSQFLEHNTYEWMPPFASVFRPFHETWFLAAFFVLIVTLFAVTAMKSFKRDSWREHLPYYGLAVFFLLLGLSANRFASTSVLALCFLSVATPGVWGLRIPHAEWAMTTVSAGLLVCLLSGHYIRTGFPHVVGSGIDYRMFPRKTLEALKARPVRGPVWNSFYHGCYLAWELDGRKQIFIHGFVVDMGIFQRYFVGISSSREQFDEIVGKYNVNEILVHKDLLSQGIIEILVKHPDWKLDSQDDASVLFERR
jgi:hypothetical protein